MANKWPRDLSHSVALYGDDAKPVDQPVQQFEALSHGSKLVTRTLKVDSVETPEPVDEVCVRLLCLARDLNSHISSLRPTLIFKPS